MSICYARLRNMVFLSKPNYRAEGQGGRVGSGSDGWLHRDIISKALPKFIAVKLIQSHEKQKCASGLMKMPWITRCSVHSQQISTEQEILKRHVRQRSAPPPSRHQMRESGLEDCCSPPPTINKWCKWSLIVTPNPTCSFYQHFTCEQKRAIRSTVFLLMGWWWFKRPRMWK